MVKISRCALDIAMAALTLILMGGCNFFYEAFDESFDSIAFILCANPDGVALGTRGNANGVDLNRNFKTQNFH